MFNVSVMYLDTTKFVQIIAHETKAIEIDQNNHTTIKKKKPTIPK